MGSGLSQDQKAFVDELFFLITSHGHPATKKELEDLVLAIYSCCPWVPESGTLDLEQWMKIGSTFQNDPKITSHILFSWCKVRASLKNLSPRNILFNQQMECGAMSMYPPLPQILPPAPSASLLPSAPPLPSQYDSYHSRKKPPDRLDNDDFSTPDLFLQNDHNAPLRTTPVVTPIAASLSAALIDSGDTAHPMISAFPIIRGTPAVAAIPAAGGNAAIPGAAAVPDRYEPIPMKLIKDLLQAVKEYGPHAPYTKALLENLSEQKLTPNDWKLVVRSLLPPAQSLLILDEMRHLATEQAEQNAQSNQAVINRVTRDQLIGDGQFQTTAQQLGLSDLAIEQLAKIMKKAWAKLPVSTEGPSPGFTTIRQGPTESFSDFVSRLITAIERQIDNHKARSMLQKQLAFENANDDCRKALTPIYSNPETTIQDMLRVCQNVGSISYKAAMYATAQQAIQSNPAQGKRCFSCGKEGHFKNQCRSTPKHVNRPSSKCPICQKGYHWASQCRSRPENQQQNNRVSDQFYHMDQGNAEMGQPQAQAKN